jgi:DNA-binding NarL/FixJ family response regulator
MRATAPLAPEDAVRTDHPPLPVGQPVTCAERRVMCLLRHGYTNKEIGHQLDRAEATIKNQVASILYKLACVNRGRAIAILNRHALACPVELGHLDPHQTRFP